MANYNNYQRGVLNTPHPLFGALPPGFSVGDLPSSYQVGLPVFTAVSANATSAPINIGANAIEMAAVFSNAATSCDITVYQADGVTVLGVFRGVSLLNCDNLYVGFAKQKIVIGGGPLVFALTNFAGTGTLTLTVRRTG